MKSQFRNTRKTNFEDTGDLLKKKRNKFQRIFESPSWKKSGQSQI